MSGMLCYRHMMMRLMVVKSKGYWQVGTLISIMISLAGL